MRWLWQSLGLLLIWLMPLQGLAQTDPIILTWDTSGNHPTTLSAAASPLGAGIAPTPMRREVVGYVATNNAYNSKNWSQGTTVDVNRYVEWGFDTTVPYTLDSLRIRLRRSSTGPSSFRIAMQIDGGAFTTVLNGTLSTTTATWFNPTLGAAAATSSVRFRLYGWNATAAGGTLRIRNQSTDPNNRGVVIRGRPAQAVLEAEKNVIVFSEDGSLCADPTASPPPLPTNPAAIPGACVQYQVTVTNTGPVAARAVNLIDPLPADLTLVTAFHDNWDVTAPAPGSFAFNAGCSAGACSVEVQNGIIPAGATATITIRATIN